MKVLELMELLEAKNIVEGVDLNVEISCGYACDLLSWVLAHGRPGMAWMTVQTHVNVVAVAVLMEMACVILVEGTEPEANSLAKAKEEGLPLLLSSKTSYELAGIMAKVGILPPVE